MSTEPTSGLGAMFGNMVFGPSTNNKKRPAPDDISVDSKISRTDEGRTDKESESNK